MKIIILQSSNGEGGVTSCNSMKRGMDKKLRSRALQYQTITI